MYYIGSNPLNNLIDKRLLRTSVEKPFLMGMGVENESIIYRRYRRRHRVRCS